MRIGNFTRRDFLKASGVGLAANSFGSVFQPLHEFALHSRPIRVGVLLPASLGNPLLGEHFITGIKTYLRQSNIPLELSVRTAEVSLINQAAQKLIAVDKADLVIALIGANLAERLRSVFEQAGILLMVADSGANAIRVDELSRYILYHTLNLWQSSWASAVQAVRQFGSKAALAASFYDSGYDSLYATQLGIEYAGGLVTDTFVTHVHPQNHRLAETLAAIRATHPDFVFAHYSGQEAVEFLDAYTRAGLTGDIPLVTSAFALHDHALTALGSALVGVQSGLAWSNQLDHAANADFGAAFRTFSGAPADPLAVLGYDTVHLLHQAVGSAGSTRADRLAQALRSAQIDSPRGALAFNPDAQTFSSPLYQAEVRYQGLSLHNVPLSVLDPVPVQEILPKFSQGTSRSGWLHPYLLL